MEAPLLVRLFSPYLLTWAAVSSLIASHVVYDRVQVQFRQEMQSAALASEQRLARLEQEFSGLRTDCSSAGLFRQPCPEAFTTAREKISQFEQTASVAKNHLDCLEKVEGELDFPAPMKLSGNIDLAALQSLRARSDALSAQKNSLCETIFTEETIYFRVTSYQKAQEERQATQYKDLSNLAMQQQAVMQRQQEDQWRHATREAERQRMAAIEKNNAFVRRLTSSCAPDPAMPPRRSCPYR
jgi:hypothetical protein